MGVAARQHKHVLDAVFCRPLRPVPDRFEPTRRIGAGDFDLFAEVGGAGGGLDCSWPSSFGCGVLSALFHGQEDHRASLALAILILSSLSSSFLVPLLAGSGSRVWTCGGVAERRRSPWGLVPSWPPSLSLLAFLVAPLVFSLGTGSSGRGIWGIDE